MKLAIADGKLLDHIHAKENKTKRVRKAEHSQDTKARELMDKTHYSFNKVFDHQLFPSTISSTRGDNRSVLST